MKTSPNFTHFALPFILLLPTSLAFAQGQVGNGGGEDIEFRKMTTDLQEWVKANLEIGKLEEKLHLIPGSGKELSEKFTAAINSSTLTFQTDEILVMAKAEFAAMTLNRTAFIAILLAGIRLPITLNTEWFFTNIWASRIMKEIY